MGTAKVVTGIVASTALIVGSAVLPSMVPMAPAADSSVQFTASGDFSASPAAASVFSQIGTLQPDLHLALGDLSYGATGAEQAWCDFVTSRVGQGFAFELLSGNHESNGQNGNVNDFAACLPNQLPGLVGSYGRQYYVDVPREDPLVRYVMISPGIPFTDGGVWSYAAGTPRYNWAAAAIDGARSSDIPWVVVGMHAPCLSQGQYGCVAGADITNLMLEKRVDLVLSGHEHLYQRTHQLAHGPGCPAVVPGTASSSCISGTGSAMTKGAGTVFATIGTGGVTLRDVFPADPEAPYFAAASGLNANPTFGSLNVTVTPGQLSAGFTGASGGTFTDAFTLGVGVPPSNVPPTATFTTSCTLLACAINAAGSADSDGSITGYAWDFGDGASGSGAQTSHDYALPGTYTVRLTVTDDDGATGTTTRSVTVQSAPQPGTFAADTFTRTVASGWGAAEQGGPWTVAGSGTSYSVGSGTGIIWHTTAGSGRTVYLSPPPSSATDLTVAVGVDKRPAGSALYVSSIGRRVAGVGEYRAKLRLDANGQTALSLHRTNASGAETSLQGSLTLPGLTYTPGDRLLLRTEVTGTGPTTIRAKAWKAGTPEPAAWQRSATDATAALQAGGTIGLFTYLSGSVTNVPVTVLIDDVTAE
ncbi:PKD domain-containing protein [Arthrobacter sp. CAN_A1]|uniref:PKD domain-containing protein n=1 Tax=Arthrobacter sp. CAN_A1 TaxID=2787717 RepID=UPI0018C8F90D